jgi:HEAT repeat protein
VLLNAAAESDAEIARPAKATLTRMESKAVDAALLSALKSQPSTTMRQAVIELAALRRIESAVPAVVASVEDSDPGVRRAALNTLSTLGSERQAGDLVRVLSKTQDADDREAIEKALTAICGRTGSKSLSHVLPLAKNKDSELRIIALRALATIGGREALSAVTAAVEDPDQEVQDEAVGTLATWPNNWPEDEEVAAPLLSLVKSDKKRAYQVQGARGYLLYVQENKKLSSADKVRAIKDLLPLLKGPPEKRLAISALGAIPTSKSLESLVALAEDPALSEEASLAIVNVASAKKLEGANKEVRQKALQTALDKSKNDSTRKKAGDALKAIE